MAIRDREKLITSIVGVVLECESSKIKFEWLKNKHLKEDFQDYFNLVNGIFESLNGNQQELENKKNTYLQYDAMFGGTYNFIFEYDEYQHFSSSRMVSLEASSNPNTRVRFGILQMSML